MGNGGAGNKSLDCGGTLRAVINTAGHRKEIKRTVRRRVWAGSAVKESKDKRCNNGNEPYSVVRMKEITTVSRSASEAFNKPA